MKSREYLNTLNGLIYWLEDDAVMMRKREGKIVKKSNMTAAIFFAMVGNDTLLLVESEPEQKSMTMNEFSNFLAGIDKSTTTATARTAIQGGATHIAIDGNGDVFAFKMRPRHCLPDDGDANDYLGEWLSGSASWATLAASIATGGNSASRSHSDSTFC